MTVVETPASSRPLASIVVLTVVAAILFGFGWVLGKISIPLGWMLAAVRVGWSDARKGGA